MEAFGGGGDEGEAEGDEGVGAVWNNTVKRKLGMHSSSHGI